MLLSLIRNKNVFEITCVSWKTRPGWDTNNINKTIRFKCYNCYFYSKTTTIAITSHYVIINTTSGDDDDNDDEDDDDDDDDDDDVDDDDDDLMMRNITRDIIIAKHYKR